MLLGQSADEIAQVRALATQAREPAPHYEHTRYVKRLGSLPGVAFMPEPGWRRPLWKPMHLQPVFAACPAHVSGLSEAPFTRGLCLPSGTGMSAEDLERVIACVLPLAGGR